MEINILAWYIFLTATLQNWATVHLDQHGLSTFTPPRTLAIIVWNSSENISLPSHKYLLIPKWGMWYQMLYPFSGVIPDSQCESFRRLQYYCGYHSDGQPYHIRMGTSILCLPVPHTQYTHTHADCMLSVHILTSLNWFVCYLMLSGQVWCPSYQIILAGSIFLLFPTPILPSNLPLHPPLPLPPPQVWDLLANTLGWRRHFNLTVVLRKHIAEKTQYSVCRQLL